MRTVLEQLGYTVDYVPDGRAALTQFDKATYDCLVTDYRMPGLDGLELFRILVGRDDASPTILMTDSGNEQVAVDAMKLGAGARHVLDKPVNTSLLARVLRDVLDGAPVADV